MTAPTTRNAWSSLALAISILLAGSVVPGAADAKEERALLLLEGVGIRETQAIVQALTAEGARVEMVVPGRAIVARFPDAAAFAAPPAGVRSVTLAGSSPEIAEDADPLLRGIVGAWKQLTGIASPEEGAATGERIGPPLAGDAAFAPYDESPSDPAMAAPPGAGFFDTSEYMLGSITVAVLLPESDGTIDPNQEDWTAAEEANVVAEVMNGMAWWTARAADIGHTLTFWFDFRFGITQGYEPITRPSGHHNLWVPAVMANLGYTTHPNFFNNVREFLNDERDAFGTDWADAMLVIDDTVDPDDHFTSGFFAFSYYGGPFLWMTYGNAGWGIDNMDMLAAHELGHQYYAFDEYASSGCVCTDQMGYLLGKNQNCDAACMSSIPECIMWSATSPIDACVLETHSAKQIGLLDADNDSIPNILDTNPETALDAFGADTTGDFTPTYTGSAAAIPKPNLNTNGPGNDITLNVVSLVECRVDGGAWTAATATDGAFDDSLELFNFTTAPLTNGSHVIEARATHSYGNRDATPAVDALFVTSSPVSVTASSSGIAERLVVGPIPSTSGVTLRFGLAEAGPVKLAVFTADGRRVLSLRDEALAAGRHEIAWDGRLGDGQRAADGVYFLRLEAARRSETVRAILVR